MTRLQKQIGNISSLFFILTILLLGTSLHADNGRVQLDWNASAEADFSHYNVYRSTESGDLSPAQINPAPLTTSTYIDTGLTFTTTYYYVVTAVDLTGNESAFSDEASATPLDSAPPTTPTDFSLLIVSNSQINLSWTASTDNAAVTAYRIYRQGTLVSTQAGTSYQDTGLSDATAYSYEVSAVDQALNESDRTAAAAGTPSDLMAHWTFDEGSGATAADSSQLNQTATLTNGPLWIDGRVSGALQFAGDDDTVNCGNNAHLNQISADFTLSIWVRNLGSATQYILDKSDLSTSFYLRTNPDNTIQFTLDDGTTQFSALSNIPLVTTDRWRHIALSVTARSAMALYIDGALQGSFLGGPLSAVGDTGNSSDLILGANHSLQDYLTGEIDDLQIYNRVLTQTEIANLYEPNPPESLSAEAGDQEITLDWSDNSESNLADYNIYRSETPGGPYTRVNSTSVTLSTYTDTAGLANATTYYYVVRARDDNMQESQDSPEASTTPVDATPPSAPDPVTVASGDAQVTVSWTASSEPDLDHYDLYRATSPSGPFSTKLNPTPIRSESYIDDTALNGTTYYYALIAVDTVGNESDSSASSAAATPGDATPPAPPTGFVVTPL